MNKRIILAFLIGSVLIALLTTGCGLIELAGALNAALQTVNAPTQQAAVATQQPAKVTRVVRVQIPTPTPAPPQPLQSEAEAANALEAQVIAVYESSAPSVVNITNRGYAYDPFMGAIPQEGSGSGFIYDTQGHIITNYHVVEGASELLVTLASKQTFPAEIVGTDATNDLAVIRIDAGNALPKPLPLADSSKLRVGQFVVAIGNPFGLEQTLTTGVVSALGRVIQSPQESRFIGEAIQTDAAINPGNSGGPLLDLSGRVIGVNSQIISPSGASSGIGFAVSANTVRRVVPELIARGHYPHPWIGAKLFSLTPASAEVFRQAGMDLPVDQGLLVVSVIRGGPSDRAGLRGSSRVVTIGRVRLPIGGDVIVSIDGQPVQSFQDLTVYLETQTFVGDTVRLGILRDGQEMTLKVTLEERPEE